MTAGTTATTTFRVTKPGPVRFSWRFSWRFSCHLPGHLAYGMTGVIVAV